VSTSQNPSPEIRDIRLYANAPETRAEPDGRLLRGYAAVFNSLSVDLGHFREIIKPGAFATSLASGNDIRALVDHDYAKILGRTSAGTLRLKEDATGLADEIDLDETSYANDLLKSVKRKDISGQSFGFRVIQDDWAYSEDDVLVRTLIEVKLFEVTMTSIPAYTDTTADVRTPLACQYPDEVRSAIEKFRRYPRRDRAARLMKIAAVE
jgi:HK97 family phage prohead protease